MSSPAHLLDAIGQAHTPTHAPARIACLVPSITELLCDLGLTEQLVARTGFCIHPKTALEKIPKVGGTKDVKLEALRALAPTHVIVNIDENEKPTVDALRAFVPHIIVTHPCAPQDNLALYRLLGGIFQREAAAEALCTRLEAALARLSSQPWPARRVLYAIWQDPWMTVAPPTYIAQMLALVNWQTWPQRAEDLTACDAGLCDAPSPTTLPRYPSFRWRDALVEQLDMVLLSSEPYRFTESHCDALERQIGKPVLLVDGEMLSWYGSRAIAGLDYLGALARGFA